MSLFQTRYGKPLAIIGVVLLLIFLMTLPIKPFYDNVLNYIGSIGLIQGSILFILMDVVCTVTFLPGVILTIFAGYYYGILVGTVISWFGGVLGGFIAFNIGRRFLTDRVRVWAQSAPFLSSLTSVINHNTEGWKIAFLLRLSPFTPYSLLNYMLAITRMTPVTFVKTTAVGMIPSTLMYAYLGTTARDISTVLGSSQDLQVDPTSQYTMMTIGIISTILVAVSISYMVKKTVKKLADATMLPT